MNFALFTHYNFQNRFGQGILLTVFAMEFELINSFKLVDFDTYLLVYLREFTDL